MTKPITPEMSAAWRTLQDFAENARPDSPVKKAIDVLDDSDYMVPIEEAEEAADEEHARLMAGLRGIDLGDRYPTRPDPAEWGDTTREDMDRHQRAQDEATLAAGGEVHVTRIALEDLHGEGLARAIRRSKIKKNKP